MKKKIIIALLVCVCILATGCTLVMNRTDEEKPYKLGTFILPLYVKSEIQMAMQSDTNEFEKDDVTVELFYGLYNNEYVGKNLEYAANHYKSGDEEPLYIGLYLHGDVVSETDYLEDYRDIEGYTLIKELSEEEAFSGKYGYDAPHRTITYNHCEMFTIPNEFFVEEEGEVNICLLVFRYESSGLYNRVHGAVIEIEYEITDEGKVLITNLEK